MTPAWHRSPLRRVAEGPSFVTRFTGGAVIVPAAHRPRYGRATVAATDAADRTAAPAGPGDDTGAGDALLARTEEHRRELTGHCSPMLASTRPTARRSPRPA